MVEFPTSTRGLVGLMWHRKLRIAFVFCVSLVLVVGLIYLFPHSYTSEAKLLLRVGRESVSLDPTASFGQTISIQQDRKDEINSVCEILKSQALRAQVIDYLGTDLLVGTQSEPTGPIGNAVKQTKTFVKNVLRVPATSEREVASRILESSVEIDSPKFTSVITIRASADSPETAQKIVAAYSEVYVEEHVRLNHSAGSYAFFEEQTTKLGQELKQAEGELRNSMNEAALLSIEGRRATLETQIGEVETRLLSNERSRESTLAQVSAIKKSLETMPANVVAQSTIGFPHAAADGMRQQLYNLEILEKQLQQEYTANHPKIVAVQKQLEDVRKIQVEQEKERTQTTSMLNPHHQKLTLDLIEQENQIATLQEESRILTKQYQQLQENLHELNNRQPQLAALQRKIDVLSTNYRTHSERLEQSRVENALASDQFSNVRIFQSATLAERPSSPKVRAMLLLGLVAAVFAGFGSAFLGDARQFQLQPLAQVGHYLADAR